MAIVCNVIDYHDEKTVLKGCIAYEDSQTQNRPVVLVAPDWSGRNEFACQKARDLAALGYIGFALDMYGEGKQGTTKDEKVALMQPLMQNRQLLIKRITAAFNHAKTLPFADAKKIAAIGFCFGGLCVLDLARSGAALTGVVSFHGLLGAPEIALPKEITSKILALHGYDDPMVPHQQVLQFADEMTAKKADWQIHMYGHTMHAFTNPDANDKAFGTVYKKQAAERSWRSMQDFFCEIFK